MTNRTISPSKRIWLRFKGHRRGYYSLVIFTVLFIFSLFAEVVSNDKPIIFSYEQRVFIPLFYDYPETNFGGDFETNADYLDPFINEKIKNSIAWGVFPMNSYSFNTINYFSPYPNPAAPSSVNFFGTDDRGRDVLARLIYGFRISVLFGFSLTVVGVFLGIFMGAIQGYFAGRTDLVIQRFIEVWGAIPELYLLIILASIFEPSLLILLLILSLFGWISLSDYVRAEFLRNRSLEYVTAAKALGLSSRSIILKHVLPNSLTPVIAFLPFRMSGAILALTSLDFLGLGVPSSTPSLGELLAQGKANLDAWWITLSTFTVLVILLVLLVFIGEGLRDSLDTRKAV